MRLGKALAAQAAQALALALTGWAVIINLMEGPDLWTVAFGGVALLLPLRNCGTHFDRARSCFIASVLLVSVVALDLFMGLIGRGLRPEAMLLLTATVLFSVAGGLHWIRRDED